ALARPEPPDAAVLQELEGPDRQRLPRRGDHRAPAQGRGGPAVRAVRRGEARGRPARPVSRRRVARRSPRRARRPRPAAAPRRPLPRARRARERQSLTGPELAFSYAAGP